MVVDVSSSVAPVGVDLSIHLLDIAIVLVSCHINGSSNEWQDLLDQCNIYYMAFGY